MNSVTKRLINGSLGSMGQFNAEALRPQRTEKRVLWYSECIFGTWSRYSLSLLL